MRSDSDIKRDVEEELRWDPDLDSTDIAVSVSKGVVTLAGFVKSYTHKLNAEEAAKRVMGVAGVANDLEVRLPGTDEAPDPEIAREAVAAIKNRLPVSGERIKPVVRNGWITLEGEVEWNFQREDAADAVRRIRGGRQQPLTVFDTLQREVEQLFDDFSRGLSPGNSTSSGSLMPSIMPRMDVAETDKQIELSIELPGLQQKDVDISVSDDMLTIRGEKKAETEQKDKTFRRVERVYGTFYRVVELPPGIDPSAINATMSNGVLRITIPKPARAETKKIEVKPAA